MSNCPRCGTQLDVTANYNTASIIGLAERLAKLYAERDAVSEELRKAIANEPTQHEPPESSK